MNRFFPFRFIAAALAAGIFLSASLAGATVTGRVFLDANRNGLADAGERGLEAVVVSDGRSVVRTAANGDYTIDAAERAPFVFVTLPRGYRAHAHRFYADAKTAGAKDFALVDWPEARADTLRLVQISDTHVTRAADTVQTFAEDAREINALEPRPAFVIATGDLVNRGAEAPQFDGYLESIAHFELPLFNLPGNHDTNTPEGLEHYHRYLGPDCYSFNAGSCHFVLLDFLRYRDAGVQAWIKADLGAAPKGATLIFAMHALPTEEQLKYFASVGAKAVLSGHWHGNRVRDAGGVMDLNTPPMRFGGIDRHPRGFRLIEIADDKVHNELRLGGFKHHAAIVAPAGTLAPAGGKLPIVVNAYDSRVDVAAVECELGGARIALKRASAWSWTGEIAAPPGTKSQRLVANIRAANGETWQAESTFSPASSAPAAVPSFRLKWVAPTGGVIGFSSPRIGRESIAIGIDDTGTLQRCGVMAFDLNGRKRWHFHTDSAIKNTIAASNGRFFATSIAGTLYAIDEATGTLAWKIELDRARPRWEVTATTVANGIVHAGAYHFIAAFDEKSGRPLWDTRAGPSGDWTQSSYAVPTIAQDSVLFFHQRYGAFAMKAQTGELAWKLEGGFSGGVVNGDTVYTLRNNQPVAIALQSGKLLWTGAEKITASASRPQWAADRIVIGTANGRVCAISPEDGRVLWNAQTGPSLTSLQPYARGGSDVNSTPTIHGNAVYVGASDGALHAFALADGAKLATHNLGVPIASSPLIVDGTLYVGGYDGNLYAFGVSQDRAVAAETGAAGRRAR